MNKIKLGIFDKNLGIEKLILEVHTDNTSAGALYKKSGFISKYKKVVMEKEL